MHVETLALLKLAILAGLAYLTFRKTRHLSHTRQLAHNLRKQCAIRDITPISHPLTQSLKHEPQQQTDRSISYEQFTKYHQIIGRQHPNIEQESDSEQAQVFSCKGDDQNECFSTAPSDQRRETLSRNSSSFFEAEDRPDANKLQCGQINLNKTPSITTSLCLKKTPSTPTRQLNKKMSYLKSKTIRKPSFYKKSKEHLGTPRV